MIRFPRRAASQGAPKLDQAPARERQGRGPRKGAWAGAVQTAERRLQAPPSPSRRQHAAPPGSAPSRLPPARRAHAWGGIEAAPRPPRCLRRRPTTRKAPPAQPLELITYPSQALHLFFFSQTQPGISLRTPFFTRPPPLASVKIILWGVENATGSRRSFWGISDVHTYLKPPLNAITSLLTLAQL